MTQSNTWPAAHWPDATEDGPAGRRRYLPGGAYDFFLSVDSVSRTRALLLGLGPGDVRIPEQLPQARGFAMAGCEHDPANHMSGPVTQFRGRAGDDCLTNDGQCAFAERDQLICCRLAFQKLTVAKLFCQSHHALPVLAGWQLRCLGGDSFREEGEACCQKQ